MAVEYMFPDGDIRRENKKPYTESTIIDMAEIMPPQMFVQDGLSIIDDDFGNTIIEFGEGYDDTYSGSPDEAKQNHYYNLADAIPEQVLDRIANEVLDYIEIDEQARDPFKRRYGHMMERLGFVDSGKNEKEVFDGASTVVYPMLSTAMVQFQSRAINEIFPSDGPVKAKIVGMENDEILKQADRIEDYENYQIMFRDRSFFEETDKMLMHVPMGCAFKKIYEDRQQETAVSKFVRPDRLIVPYNATCLQTSPRFAHYIPMNPNEVKINQQKGFFRDVELVQPSTNMEDSSNPVVRVEEELDSKQAVMHEKDYQHDIYESHIFYDLDGFKDKDEYGEETGVALPYVIYVDKDSRKVLAIYREWEEGGDQYQREEHFVKYTFLPGPNFYEMGIDQLIGGIADAVTGSVRALLNASVMASMQGGFKAKDAHAKGGRLSISPGVYKDVDMTSDELNKAFYTPNFKEPSTALYQVISLLIDAGERATNTTEATVGDANPNAPVGTTLALIEQGSKVYSAIHKRLHQAAAKEYQIRARINGKLLRDDLGGYPYDIEDEERQIAVEDYDGRVDVIPVSDPNTFSSTQRIARAQGVMQLAEQSPDLYNRFKVHKDMLAAMNVPNSDEYIKDPTEKKLMDAVTENMSVMSGSPIAAFAHQDHAAHIQVHQDFLAHQGFGGNPEMKKVIEPEMMAHIAEHMAYLYAQRMREMGIMTPEVNLNSVGMDVLEQELTPEQEMMISRAAAQGREMFMQMPGMNNQQFDPRTPEQIKAEGEVEIKKMKAGADIEASQAKTQAQIQNEQAKTQADIAMDVQKTNADIAMDNKEMQAEIVRDTIKAGVTEAAGDSSQKSSSKKLSPKESSVASKEGEDEGVREVLEAMKAQQKVDQKNNERLMRAIAETSNQNNTEDVVGQMGEMMAMFAQAQLEYSDRMLKVMESMKQGSEKYVELVRDNGQVVGAKLKEAGE